jgi:Tol biopolymer transport system component
LKDFGSKYTSMTFGQNEGSFSEDGSTVVITCQYEGQLTGFAYNVTTGEKGKNLWASEINKARCDNARISPKGTYILWNFDPDIVVVTDLAGAIVTTLPDKYISHFDVIVDPAGDEVVVGRVNSSSVGQGKDGLVSKYRLRDGARTGLTSGGWCSHTSTRAQGRRRWAVSDALNTGSYPPYNGEILMAELDGSNVYRVCHSRTPAEVDYRAEVQASHSPDGSRIIFASAWGKSGSTPRPIGAYVADMLE